MLHRISSVHVCFFILLGAVLFGSCGLMNPLPLLEPPEYKESYSTEDENYIFEHPVQSAIDSFRGYEIFYKFYPELNNEAYYISDRNYLEDLVVVNKSSLEAVGYQPFLVVGQSPAMSGMVAATRSYFGIEIIDDNNNGIIKESADGIVANRYNLLDLGDILETFTLRRNYQSNDWDITAPVDSQTLSSHDFSSIIQNDIAEIIDTGGTTITLKIAFVVTAYGLTPYMQSIYSSVVIPSHTYDYDQLPIVELEIDPE